MSSGGIVNDLQGASGFSNEYGDLGLDEIEAVLREQIIGRIACQADGQPYVVPVAYAYDGTSVYGYSADGLKLRIMRQHSLVCFEVDEIENQTNWRSVVAYGRYEELREDQAYDAVRLLAARSIPTFVTRRGRYGLAYRIVLSQKTGRYERRTKPS